MDEIHLTTQWDLETCSFGIGWEPFVHFYLHSGEPTCQSGSQPEYVRSCENCCAIGGPSVNVPDTGGGLVGRFQHDQA